MMEFYFDETKARELSVSLKKVHALLDNHFQKYGVKKISEGIYLTEEDTQDTFNAFMLASTKLPKNDWFLKIIKEWYVREEGNEIEDREDCLEIYYRVKQNNVRRYRA